MAKRRDVREQNGEAKPLAKEAASVGAESAAPPALEASSAAAAGAETSTVEAKLPPLLPIGDTSASAPPPPFLREHESRIVAARGPAQPRPGAGRTEPPAKREKTTSRFPLLAATLALAAGLGGGAGAVAIPALAHYAFGPAAAAQPASDAGSDAQAMKALIAQLATDLAALRTAVEQSTKVAATQFAKVTERLDRAERAQAEASAKIAKASEAVERLERRATPAAAAAPPAQADVTGSINAAHPPGEPKAKPTIIEDYVVRKVFDGVALVEGRRGIIEVEPGSTLAGAGRVEEIRRQDGRWVVVTSKGLIVPAR
jgi:hypothetical protein